MIIYVRHGERADHCNDPKEYNAILKEYDPHLTKVGEKQAQMTGELISKVILEYQNKINKECKIHILTSPFLRCIMTARNIVSKLQGIKEIHLQDEIGELMYTYDFSSNILGQIHSRSSQEKMINEKYLNLGEIQLKKDNLVNHQQLVKPTFPENHNLSKKRISAFHKVMVERAQVDHIYVCVTHQGIVELISSIHNKHSPYIDFCGLTSTVVDFSKQESQLGLIGVHAWK